jgi:hypothetical protein
MKTNVKIHLKEGEIEIQCELMQTESTFVNLKELFPNQIKTMLFEKKHTGLQTQFNLSNVNKCWILLFNENKEFVGVKPHLFTSKANYQVLITEPYVLLLAADNKLVFEEIVSISFAQKKKVYQNIIKNNDFEYDPHIEIEVDGKMVFGKINKLHKYYIEVEIIFPFANWKNHLSISGIGKMDPNNFYKRYQKVSERLLKQTYKLIDMIDTCIDRYLESYVKMQEEIATLSEFENTDIIERIKNKLNYYFFNNLLSFHNSDIIITIFDKDVILNVLEVYRKNRIKIYAVEFNLFELKD